MFILITKIYSVLNCFFIVPDAAVPIVLLFEVDTEGRAEVEGVGVEG